MKKVFKGIVRFLLVLVIAAAAAAGAGIIYLSATEFSPDSTESLDVYGSPTIEVLPGDRLRVMTYNIGSGIMRDDVDYYTEGGKSARPLAESGVTTVMDEILKLCSDKKAHVNFFQEVDIDSHRSCSVDEASVLSNGIYGRASVFAEDTRCAYVPVPFGSFGSGKVRSGMLTLTRFNADSAERRMLTDGSSWPASTWSRKPALLVEHIKLGDTTKELVLINLNFEKYDDGTIRAAQYKELCEYMQLEFAKGNYVIAGGSFYAALPSADKSHYRTEGTEVFTPCEISTENLTGGWKYCTGDGYPTMRLMNAPFDDDTAVYIVDGFITSPNTIVENTETLYDDFKLSNHCPVVTEVTLVK